MSRRLGIQYPRAIYQVMAPGNAHQDIVRDCDDRERLQQELGRATVRFGWVVDGLVIMSNDLHVVLKTPEPKLGQRGLTPDAAAERAAQVARPQVRASRSLGFELVPSMQDRPAPRCLVDGRPTRIDG
jgi:hypothetical protein